MSLAVETRDLRPAGALMLAGGLLLPLLPGHAGLPCPLRTLTGVPCPLCGMTTSVESTVHAHPLNALRANPAGPLFVAAAVAFLVIRPRRFAVPRVVPAAALLMMWLFELHRFGVL